MVSPSQHAAPGPGTHLTAVDDMPTDTAARGRNRLVRIDGLAEPGDHDIDNALTTAGIRYPGTMAVPGTQAGTRVPGNDRLPTTKTRLT